MQQRTWSIRKVHHKPDPAIFEAVRHLQAFFAEHPEEVFYMKQLEVRFEREHFHWITGKAINYLIDIGKCQAL